VPVDIIDLPVGMQRYAMFTNEQGGILDDLMVANLGDDTLFLVVNAACKDQDLAHLRAHRRPCEVQPLFEERALLALQGPAAVKVLERLAPEVAGMTFMQFRPVTAGRGLLRQPLGLHRRRRLRDLGTGRAEALARRLLAEPEVQPSAWARATRCAWKPACACTATT
jgi:aminomethyltransferase